MNTANNRLLVAAAEQGHVQDVARLIPLSDPTINNNEALRMAAKEGHVECVELLIPVSTTSSGALWMAAVYNRADCVERLIPVTGKKNMGAALSAAHKYGHVSCVTLLLPHTPVSYDNYFPLRLAFEYQDHDAIKKLLKRKNLADIIQSLQKSFPEQSQMWVQLQAGYENKLLSSCVRVSSRHSQKRKM